MTVVRFLLDEHVPRVFERTLTERGFVVEQAKDRFGEQTDDARLLEWCAEHEVAVVTNNAQDFAGLHRDQSHAGILLYRRQDLPIADPEGLASAVEQVTSQYGTGGLADELVELDEWYEWLHDEQ